MINAENVWELLAQVKDPEIPVVSVVEMGLIRNVEVENDQVKVALAPTFAGCPAIDMMCREIESRLLAAGAHNVEVEIVFSPPWSSDWIQPSARQKLKTFGIAPPQVHAGDLQLALNAPVACPYCGGKNTVVKNTFGPTLCRSLYFCLDCREPFEKFKAL